VGWRLWDASVAALGGEAWLHDDSIADIRWAIAEADGAVDRPRRDDKL
jgi:hypothetical protein